uniref:Zn(2)-C6 fungal-type domain-containing protein n=1 Tax=Kwoniella dejecticola CBS 10117 TaxID=1296121 RepID=A0A1A6A7V7_9TREE|nr:uncharacterized protein I303_03857 [Kwoniella dejecticola CBS 10117]OBR86137.1 hypothetical protein I303_03857 [Kwoniella dejecticola CBS 10117]
MLERTSDIGMTQNDEDRPSRQVCDWCRSQKVKCKPLEEADVQSAKSADLVPTCQRCFRRKEKCTFTYTLKKPGRPSNLSHEIRQSRSASPIRRRRGSQASTAVASNISPIGVPLASQAEQPTQEDTRTDNQAPIQIEPLATRPAADNSFQDLFSGISATTPSAILNTDDIVSALRQSTPQFHFPPGHLANATLPLNNADWASFAFQLPEDVLSDTNNQNQSASNVPPIETPSSATFPLLPATQPLPLDESPSEAAVLASLKLTAEPGSFMPIDVVAPWSDISFFISLHMIHQHSLVPIVHRPTFANDLLHRRDQRDETFRGFLASIGHICQSPMSLVGQQHTRERLKRIMFRAHRFSRACQLRNSHQPTLPMLASVILDLISTQATEDTISTDLLAAEARRLVYTLRVNQAEPRAGMSLIDKQICHRMYWEVVAVGTTLAMNGAPIMLQEMEGTPPLPIAVDDEYISEENHFPQPASKRSYLTGFIIITKMFRILGQCLQRHRMFLREPGIFDNTDLNLEWIEAKLADVRALVDDVPIPTVPASTPQGDQQSWWGIQCVNIHITALCTEFACIDFRSALVPGFDSPPRRQIIARKAYDALSSIPIECLASNGQSLRSKILRVVMSLLTLAPDPNDMSAHVWDWWNLYHSVQYIQAVPENSQT